MNQVSKELIQELCEPHIARRGKLYYEQNRVRIVGTELLDEVVEVTGKVKGSRVYTTEVLFDMDGEFLSAGCECPYFHQYNDPCKHIAAMFYSLNNYDSPMLMGPQVSNENEKVANDLIAYFTQQASFPEVKKELGVKFILRVEGPHFMSNTAKLSIEMKVGVERLYVVKDIKQVLESIGKGNLHRFTSKFTLDLTQHKFKEADYRLIQLLLDIIQNDDTAHRDNFYYRPSANGRVMSIPSIVNQRFLQRVTACDDVVIENSIVGEVPLSVVENRFPGAFSVEKEGQSYQFRYSEHYDSLIQIPQSNYVYFGERFYHLNDEQKNHLFVIHDMMKQVDGQLVLSRNDIEKLSGTVFPILKGYELLEVDDSIREDFVEEPLNASVYLDIEEDRMLAKVIFAYGEREINPLDESTEEKQEKIIVRNMEKEGNVLAIIEEVPFYYNGTDFFIEGDEEYHSFLYHYLPKLSDLTNIYMTNSVKNLYVDVNQAPKVTIDFSEGNLLEIGFETGDIEKDELVNVFRSLIEKKKYHKLNNGAILPLESSEWENIEGLIEMSNLKAKDMVDGKVKLPSHTAFQLDGLFNDKEKVKKSKDFKKLIQMISNPDTIDEEVPSTLADVVRDYQERGFNWFTSLARYGFGGVLADDMGLGKTLQTITFMLSERMKDQKRPPFLVVAPASLIYNWEKELDKFAPELTVSIIDGKKAEREKKLTEIDSYDIFITSYPLLRRDYEQFEDIHFSGLILDEAQALKNSASLTYKAVRTIRADTKFALSGTPIENRIDELYSLFSVIMPGFFNSKKAFNNLSEKMIRKRIMPFILRRTKKEVLKELPEKIETTRITELTKDQRELYVGYLQRIQQEALSQLSSEGFDKSRIKILAGLTRLRQLCCHPSLFLENYQGESGKLNELLEFLQDCHENKRRVLVFSQFTSMLEIIRDILAEKGMECFYLDGNTPVKDRLNMVDDFNEGTETVFLISLKAGGTGLNLTGADTVVLYDLWWNPAVEQQAADRAHRLGQKNVVQVVKFVTKGTIEEKIMQLQEKKKALFDNVIQSGEASLSSLSEKDIREILSI
ncbi:DEAD/DEAH box helicase [Bacillus sp. FJAT-45350]|uniref:DEAD/DEAH box helicase n=1 Tax=Bacillus sp. FJAT-45350 TaxID=2011014 RepID=UPI0015C88192|nr:DEAD/DEAH box helicase [Bacillus sp. FJAT-45350]